MLTIFLQEVTKLIALCYIQVDTQGQDNWTGLEFQFWLSSKIAAAAGAERISVWHN